MYFAQVQFGMAILNIQKTDFIIYSSFDKNIRIIPVDFDPRYSADLLLSLKLIFFNFMLHNPCKEKTQTE